MAIADEIAAKESVQVQQPLPHIQSVNSVSKNSNASSSSSGDSASKNSAVSPSSGGNSRVPLSLRQGVLQIRLRSASRIRTLVLQQYDELFQSELGCYTGEPVVLNDSKGAKFHKARVVPYALQSKVESTLLKMEKDGVIQRVTSAVSEATIVVVGKKESEDVRDSADFSVTYNAYADVETYPMPQIEDMHSALRGRTVISVLDIKQAYLQIPIT